MSKAFYTNFEKNRVQGTVEKLDALKQTMLMMLSTERYAYPIYNFDYGACLEKYIGKNLDYIKGDLPREVTECLLLDDRILSVGDFTFADAGDGDLSIGFTVSTIYGTSNMEVSLTA